MENNNNIAKVIVTKDLIDNFEIKVDIPGFAVNFDIYKNTHMYVDLLEYLLIKFKDYPMRMPSVSELISDDFILKNMNLLDNIPGYRTRLKFNGHTWKKDINQYYKLVNSHFYKKPNFATIFSDFPTISNFIGQISLVKYIDNEYAYSNLENPNESKSSSLDLRNLTYLDSLIVSVKVKLIIMSAGCANCIMYLPKYSNRLFRSSWYHNVEMSNTYKIITQTKITDLMRILAVYQYLTKLRSIYESNN